MKYKILLILFVLLSSSLFSQSGFVYTYYSSGEVDGVLFFVNDVLDGKSYWYHENGNLKAEKNYSNGKLDGLVKEFYDTGLRKKEIGIKFGVRDGLTKTYYENGALKSILSFENGILIKQVNIDNDPFYVAPLEAYKYANTQDRIKDNEDLFICEGADICPKPVGGMNEILKHLVYPEHAKLYGLEGFVTIVVTIDTLGVVENITVLNDLGLGTKEASIDAVKASRFLPGEKDGKQVKSKVLFKIPFMLNGKILYATSSPKSKEKESLASKSIKSENTIPTIEKTIDSKEKSLIVKNREIPKVEVPIKNFDCETDICAKPKDGIKSILDNFIMPAMVKRKGLEGEVVVEAEVDIYGNVRDTKVIKELGYGCDIAVEVAILQTKFEPGISEGKPIRSKVKIRVPIIQKKVTD
jgi:TonB family protein